MKPLTIERLTVTGYKGGTRAHDMSALTLITGPNGSGKSTLVEAIDFLFGRPVCGASPDGADLREALDGQTLQVSAQIGAVSASRIRTIDKKDVFKKSELAFNDQSDGAAAAMASALGDLSAPRGAVWLSLSDDKLGAELAKLGATDAGVARAVALLTAHDEKLALQIDAGTSAAARLGTCRELAKKQVNAADQVLKGIGGSADRSREANKDDEAITAEHLAALEAQIQTAEQAKAAALEERTRLTAAPEAARRERDQWEGTGRALADAVEGAKRAVAEIPGANPVSSDEQADAYQAFANAESYLNDCVAEANVAAQAANEANADFATAVAVVNGLDANLRACADPTCPTCSQPIPKAVVDVLRGLLDAKREALAEADAALKAAREYSSETAKEILSARKELDRRREVSADLKRRAAREDDLTTRRTAAAKRWEQAQAGLNTHLGKPAPQVVEVNEEAVAEATRKAAEANFKLTELRTRLLNDTAAQVRYARWRKDLSDRRAAEALKAKCDTLLNGVRGIEDAMLSAGAEKLVNGMASYVPEHLGEPTVKGGRIGLLKGGKFICGAGLSGAQHVAMALAIDRSLDTLYDRKFRLAVVEADALDPKTLDHVMAALEAGVEMGEIHQAVVVTCHEPSSTAGWHLIRTGAAPSPPSPGGGEPAPNPVKRQEKAPDAPLLSDAAMSERTRAMFASPVDGTWGPEPTEATAAPDGGPSRREAVAGALDRIIDGLEPSDADEAGYAEFMAAGAPDEPPLLDDEACSPVAAAAPVKVVVNLPEPMPAELLSRLSTPPAAAAKAPAPGAVSAPPPGIADWLWRPKGPGDKPSADAIAQLANSMSAEAVLEMREWPSSGPNPIMRSLVTRGDAAEELTSKHLIVAGDMTMAGAAVWRHINGIDAPGPPPTEAERAKAADAALAVLNGAGLTLDEATKAIRSLGATALRHLGITRAGLAGNFNATPPIWRRKVAEVFHQRGYDAESVARWVADAAQLHPKRSRGAAAEDGTEPEADVAPEGENA